MKRIKEKLGRFNEATAKRAVALTGNMYFFWISLLFILILRCMMPLTPEGFLLNIENDLQLLLLAANAVVGSKQLVGMNRLLNHIDRDLGKDADEAKAIKKILRHIDRQVDKNAKRKKH